MTHDYPEWKRLVDLLATVKREGFARLEAAEIIEFGKLYRRAAAELSFHRTRGVEPARVAFLNDLVGQCYPHVYAAPRQPWPSLLRFFAVEFPCAFRRHAWLILIAFLLSMVPAGICYGLTRSDRLAADQVLPEFTSGIDTQIQRHQDNDTDWLPLEQRPQDSALIMTNNVRVTILSFAGGMTAGIMTIIIMVTNGIMLGTLAAGVEAAGPQAVANFWGFIAPHGVIELTAIFIAGGAGLVLAYALVNPGEAPRLTALKRAGGEALLLMLGVAAMLVVAGLVEGFFSPIPPERMAVQIKYLVAGCEGILLFSYLCFAGRRAPQSPTAASATLMAPIPPV